MIFQTNQTLFKYMSRVIFIICLKIICPTIAQCAQTHEEIFTMVKNLSEKLHKEPPEEIYVRVTFKTYDGPVTKTNKVKKITLLRENGLVYSHWSGYGPEYPITTKQIISLEEVQNPQIPEPTLAPDSDRICPTNIPPISTTSEDLTSQVGHAVKALIAPIKTLQELQAEVILLAKLIQSKYSKSRVERAVEIIEAWPKEHLDLLNQTMPYTDDSGDPPSTENGTLLLQAFKKHQTEIAKALLIKEVTLDSAAFNVANDNWGLRHLLYHQRENQKEYQAHLQARKQTELVRRQHLQGRKVKKIRYLPYPDTNPKNPNGRTFVRHNNYGDNTPDGYPHTYEEEEVHDPSFDPSER